MEWSARSNTTPPEKHQRHLARRTALSSGSPSRQAHAGCWWCVTLSPSTVVTHCKWRPKVIVFCMHGHFILYTPPSQSHLAWALSAQLASCVPQPCCTLCGLLSGDQLERCPIARNIVPPQVSKRCYPPDKQLHTARTVTCKHMLCLRKSAVYIAEARPTMEANWT